jgi:hypothetical protein
MPLSISAHSARKPSSPNFASASPAAAVELLGAEHDGDVARSGDGERLAQVVEPLRIELPHRHAVHLRQPFGGRAVGIARGHRREHHVVGRAR